MAFLLVTALLSGVVIFLVAPMLGWILRKVAPRYMADLSPLATTVALVSIATAAYLRHDPTEHRGAVRAMDVPNIGGQVIGGVLAAGGHDVDWEDGGALTPLRLIREKPQDTFA